MHLSNEITGAELPEAVGVLLAPPGSRRAADEHVRGFLDYLETAPVQWEGVRVGPAGAPRALVLAILLPGRVGMVLMPPLVTPTLRFDEQAALLQASLERLRTRRLHFAQALLAPGAARERELLRTTGFAPLAILRYLDRDVTFPWVDPPAAHEATWVAYEPRTHDRFVEVVGMTYVDSADCPELSRLRPVEDAVAAHRASGVFTPQWWQLAVIDGEPAGVLLLAGLPRQPAAELVYMGVVPAMRQRGVGKLLLRQALSLCRAERVKHLTIVVDERNTAAARLYAAYGAEEVSRREAYLYRWEAG